MLLSELTQPRLRFRQNCLALFISAASRRSDPPAPFIISPHTCPASSLPSPPETPGDSASQVTGRRDTADCETVETRPAASLAGETRPAARHSRHGRLRGSRDTPRSETVRHASQRDSETRLAARQSRHASQRQSRHGRLRHWPARHGRLRDIRDTAGCETIETRLATRQ